MTTANESATDSIAMRAAPRWVAPVFALASRADRPAAILSAVLIELPLAAVCGWIVQHVDQVVERRLRQLARRAARFQQRSAQDL